jgi:hypothetical protein
LGVVEVKWLRLDRVRRDFTTEGAEFAEEEAEWFELDERFVFSNPKNEIRRTILGDECTGRVELNLNPAI